MAHTFKDLLGDKQALTLVGLCIGQIWHLRAAGQ